MDSEMIILRNTYPKTNVFEASKNVPPIPPVPEGRAESFTGQQESGTWVALHFQLSHFQSSHWAMKPSADWNSILHDSDLPVTLIAQNPNFC